jgi:serine/threonine protein kinase
MRKERIEFKEICKIQDASALDLLNRMLELDHKKRITAEEALRHSFFTKIYAE